MTVAATAASTYALDAIATAAGLALAASHVLRGVDHALLLAFLAVSYVVWAIGLRANLRANWALLEQTGTSTNALSKAAYELARLRTASARARRVAAAIGYVGTELAKEAPYYAGAFGAALLSDSVSSREAIVFLAGANLGAAAYEYGLARLTQSFLGGDRAGARPMRHRRRARLRLLRRRLGPEGLPDGLLQRRRAGRTPHDRVLRRRHEARDARRADPLLRCRAHPPPRLPGRRQGLGDPPRRVPAGQPARDRALARARRRRP